MTDRRDDERINFAANVPELLYKHAGGRCSVPRCKNPTMGPFYERDGAVNMGVACHIYSASKNGPRGRGGKDAEFIRSEHNGIWCCQYHAALIDKGNGIDYPADVLFAWKDLAEARTRKQMNDIPSPLGWVESIEFKSFVTERSQPKLELSRRTLIWGPNGSGKTSLFEMAASINQSRYANRFNGTKRRGEDGVYYPVVFSATVIYSTVDTLSKEVNLSISGQELKRTEGATPCLLPPGDIEVIFCSTEDAHQQEHEDDVDFMMRTLNVDKSALYALANIGTKTILPGKIEFGVAEIWDDEDGVLRRRHKQNGELYYELRFKIDGSDSFVSFAGLSGSEQDRLLIDLLITKAREVSKQRLTLLLVESLAVYLDEANFAALLTALAQEEFQTVVSLPQRRVKDVLEGTSVQYRLRSLDYLTPWRLAVIQNEPMEP